MACWRSSSGERTANSWYHSWVEILTLDKQKSRGGRRGGASYAAEEYVVPLGDDLVVEVLRWIAKSPEGAQAVVDADVLDFVDHFLKELNTLVQRETCKMPRALASHGSTVNAVLSATPCAHLVSLLR
ncbi:hypothetical protein DFH09DRAFT_1078292 [Mycena vulgaris]|nr:hypothetical protein DFH09DRAFT_1078292 [Mycena vulgaris]